MFEWINKIWSIHTMDTCVVVQSLTHVWLSVTPWTAAHQAFLSSNISWSLLKLMPIELVILSNHLTICRLFLLPAIFPSIRVFPDESAFHIRWSKYWSFSFSIIPSNEYLGLISSRIDLFGCLAVQGAVKSLLQQDHNLKASILWCSAFFLVQLSHLYTKNHSFDFCQIFVSKMMSMPFNTTRFVIQSNSIQP